MKINEQNYVDEAERVIKKLDGLRDKGGKKIQIVTTSKLRNLLAMTADIYNEVMTWRSENLSEDICSRIEYLRVRFLYEAGREKSVYNLVTEAGLLDILKQINGYKKNYILFSRYMEALVAFRKFYGGDDK